MSFRVEMFFERQFQRIITVCLVGTFPTMAKPSKVSIESKGSEKITASAQLTDMQ